jgi:hypothetical protein
MLNKMISFKNEGDRSSPKRNKEVLKNSCGIVNKSILNIDIYKTIEEAKSESSESLSETSGNKTQFLPTQLVET